MLGMERADNARAGDFKVDPSEIFKQPKLSACEWLVILNAFKKEDRMSSAVQKLWGKLHMKTVVIKELSTNP